jgi:hypothetical protein
MYLLPEVNLRAAPEDPRAEARHAHRLARLGHGRLGAGPTVTLPVPDKKVGLEKSSKVHLWIVPAQIDGAWCGSGKSQGDDARHRAEIPAGCTGP